MGGAVDTTVPLAEPQAPLFVPTVTEKVTVPEPLQFGSGVPPAVFPVAPHVRRTDVVSELFKGCRIAVTDIVTLSPGCGELFWILSKALPVMTSEACAVTIHASPASGVTEIVPGVPP